MVATEKRLIDANALIDQMYNHYEVRNPAQNATMDECCMMVFNSPTVDAVEVVRCKDCKMLHQYAPEQYYCNITGIPIDEDDFCSYGERRTDDT